MNVYRINPLSDPRWDDLAAAHPDSSAFHQRGWLEALRRTYSYQPLAVTSTPPDAPLKDGVVFCRVASWITGTRLVSLPFSDHCHPLLARQSEFPRFAEWMRAECDRQEWRYAEIRPLPLQDAVWGLQPGDSFCFHQLDLRPSLERLFQGLHESSIQRKIQRAEKEGLSYEAGRSTELLNQFYRLLIITRRRHRLLPQPRIWFRNVIDCMGDGVQIRLARKDSHPVAALLTLRHRSTMVYKYGCSDEKYHNLGGMPFLFWKLIEEGKAEGAENLDFGRSDLDNEGLIVFKDRFGASKKTLTYCRYTPSERAKTAARPGSKMIRRFFSILPGPASSAAGRLLYRHMG